MHSLTIDVHGLDCPSEVKIIRAALRPHVADEQVRFDLINAHVLIEMRTSGPSAETLVNAINRAGLRAQVCTGHGAEKTNTDSPGSRLEAVLFASSGLLLVAAFVAQLVQEQFALLAPLHFFSGTNSSLAVKAMLSIAALLGASLALPKAWAAVKNLRADMHVLMGIAVAGALLLGESVEAAMVAFLFAVSLRLEQWSVARARDSVTALLQLSPPEALVV